MKESPDLTVGKYLQQERERKGLSIEAVSEVTRISAKSLEALESDDFIALPATIFIRSFLKAYASVLGLDVNKVIGIYESQTGLIGTSTPKSVPPEKPFSRRIFLVLIPILIALFGGGIYLFSSSSPRISEAPSAPPPAPPTEVSPAPPPPPPAPPQSLPVQEAEKPPAKEPPVKKQVAAVPPAPLKSPSPSVVASSSPPSAPVAEEKKERRHILRVQAREQTWVRVQADDQPEFEVLLEPQEKAVWTARRQMKITLGNAGGLDMNFNGKKVNPPGESGQVVHLQFPPEEKKSRE